MVASAIASPPHATAAAPPLRAGPVLAPDAFADVRRRLMLDACKWDPQVGDVATLAPFPLVLPADVWHRLAQWSESLAAEAEAAERELLCEPTLQRRLGLPRRIRRLLGRAGDAGTFAAPPPAARVVRFDFHLTDGSPQTGGWQISEANADVPGGYAESSAFTALMAPHFPGLRPAGDPGGAYADAIADAARAGGVDGPVALLSAAGYMEDQQVVSYLARLLRVRGLSACLASPRQLRWHDGYASLDSGWHRGPVAAVVRFYQGEWLAALPRRCGWGHLFAGGRTPVTNPGTALLVESKRFPLAWDHLHTPVPTWRALLPETRDPRDAPWRTDEGWLLKRAFCNTGDAVCSRAWSAAMDWRSAARSARWFPGGWAAQRRFESVAIDTPHGPRYACVGVYTVNGKAAGAYGRLSPRPVVDYAAIDAAVLVEA